MSNDKPYLQDAFKELSKLTKAQEAMNKPILQAFQKYNEMMQPINDAMKRYQEKLQPLVDALNAQNRKIQDLGNTFSEAFRPIRAIHRITASQNVFWEYITSEFVDIILNSQDVNESLQEYESKDNYRKSNAVIEKCSVHLFVEPQKRLYEQTIKVYREGQYELAVIGLMSVIDCALSIASGDPTNIPKTRCEALIKKLADNTDIDNEEYAILMLVSTFQAMFRTLYKRIDFKEIPPYDEEPEKLNRHWSIHGRSIREKTRFDCIKLINFLYGIILIDELTIKE